MSRFLRFQLLTIAASLAVATPIGASQLAGSRSPIVDNTNRISAGILSARTLRIALVAQMGLWYPDGPGTIGIPIAAFGEVGKPLQLPGPLLRAPAGTTVIVSLRNALPNRTLRIHGIAVGAGGDSPIVLRSGDTRTIVFRRDLPGTYGYWAGDAHDSLRSRFEDDAGLAGAIVVDDPHVPRPNDRVFVINDWDHVWRKNGDPNYNGELLTINGRSWPATERLSYVRGQTVRWRVYNASLGSHPLHLHGFPFTLDAVGDGVHAVSFVGRAPYREVTQRIASGETFDAHWIASRVGTWMFHCHLSVHTMPHAPLAELITGILPHRSLESALHLANNNSMGGMMMSVRVVPAPGDAAASEPVNSRRLALDVVETERPADSKLPFDRYAYVLHDPVESAASTGTLGPLIVLNAGEPVAIAVTNHLHESTTVHWHGMPVQQSVTDGGMFMQSMAMDGSAMPMSAPPIAPGQTFVARFTPSYAGTFMYHTHMDDTWQLVGGLSGPLIVEPQGAHFDPSTDHVVMLTSPAEEPFGDAVSINGFVSPPPIIVHAGVPQRFRLINMTLLNADLVVSLNGAASLTWSPLAKDGLDLDPSMRTPRPAVAQLTVGETRDFAFVCMQPGHLTLNAFDGAPVGKIAIEVVP